MSFRCKLMNSIFPNHCCYQCINRKASWKAKILRRNSFSQLWCPYHHILIKYNYYLSHNNWLSEWKRIDTPWDRLFVVAVLPAVFLTVRASLWYGREKLKVTEPFAKGSMDPKVEMQPMLRGPQSPLLLLCGQLGLHLIENVASHIHTSN